MEQLSELMRKVFGSECRVDVKLVDYIPREPSGKYRYYIPPQKPGFTFVEENVNVA
jgi:hypothetical protein